MNELKKYIIEGQIQDELINEMNQVPSPVNEENEYMKHKASKLVENVLREFEMAMGPMNQAEDPYEKVDPRIKKSQYLIRVIQDNIWKLCDYQRNNSLRNEVETDDDIEKMMSISLEPIIKAAVSKLNALWAIDTTSKEEPKTPEPREGETTIVIGQEVQTPQQESLKVKEILGDKIMLEDINGLNKIVEKNIFMKWIKG